MNLELNKILKRLFMGISAGGLAVPFNGTMENAIELVSGWKNRTINVVSLSERTDFDTRYDNCISLNSVHDKNR
ncbi:hypothetical protein KTJ49_11080 [Acinetobacter baumannii]|nr:hypothetical protein [Acinetobacter baumannii]